MPNPLYDISKLPATSQAAIREFDDRYIASIGAAQPPTWSDLGDLIPVSAPMVTFPVSSFGLRYRQTTGENRFRTLREGSFDVKTEEFDEGYEGELIDILSETFAYRNWLQGPSRLLIAEGRHRNRAIVTLLEAGESTAWPIDAATFFSATHLSDFTNPASTTWSNYQVNVKDVVSIPNIEAEVTIMQGALDENGEKVGANPDTILVPTAKFEPLKNLLAKENILDATGVTTETNPYRGRFNVVHVPEFTDVNDWYLVDSTLRASIGLPPWLALRWMIPTNSALALRYYDESSDFFKDTGRIKASSHIWTGHALGFPHSIRKVKGA